MCCTEIPYSIAVWTRTILLVAVVLSWQHAETWASHTYILATAERGDLDDETYARFSGVGSIQVLVSHMYVRVLIRSYGYIH